MDTEVKQFDNIEDLNDFTLKLFGPYLKNFCYWINDTKNKLHNDSSLFFLSRDSYLVKIVYDTIYPDDKLDSHYILSSRSATSFSYMADGFNIKEMISKFPKNMTIENAFLYGFHLCSASGLNPNLDGVKLNIDDGIKGNLLKEKNSKMLLYDIIKPLKNLIIHRAKEHNKYYEKHLRGCGNWSNPSVIDMGFRASSQALISKLLRRKVQGFYLISYKNAREVHKKYGPVYAYNSNFINPKNEKSFLNRYKYIFETLLCIERKSFLHFTPEGDPVFFEYPRNNITSKKMNIIEDSVKEYLKEYQIENCKNFDYEFLRFLSKPRLEEALIFEGLIHENIGNNFHDYLISPKSKQSKSFSIWIEGQKRIDQCNPGGDSPIFLKDKIEAKVMKLFLTSANYARYISNRKLFNKHLNYFRNNNH